MITKREKKIFYDCILYYIHVKKKSAKKQKELRSNRESPNPTRLVSLDIQI